MTYYYLLANTNVIWTNAKDFRYAAFRGIKRHFENHLVVSEFWHCHIQKLYF